MSGHLRKYFWFQYGFLTPILDLEIWSPQNDHLWWNLWDWINKFSVAWCLKWWKNLLLIFLSPKPIPLAKIGLNSSKISKFSGKSGAWIILIMSVQIKSVQIQSVITMSDNVHLSLQLLVCNCWFAIVDFAAACYTRIQSSMTSNSKIKHWHHI